MLTLDENCHIYHLYKHITLINSIIFFVVLQYDVSIGLFITVILFIQEPVWNQYFKQHCMINGKMKMSGEFGRIKGGNNYDLQ